MQMSLMKIVISVGVFGLLSGCTSPLHNAKTGLGVNGRVTNLEYKDAYYDSRKAETKSPVLSGTINQSQKDDINILAKLLDSRSGAMAGTIERNLSPQGYSLYSWSMLGCQVYPGEESYLQAEVLFNVSDFEIIQVNSEFILKKSTYAYDINNKKITPLMISKISEEVIDEKISGSGDEIYRSSYISRIAATPVEVDFGNHFAFYRHASYDVKYESESVNAVIVHREGRWLSYLLDWETIPAERKSSSRRNVVSGQIQLDNFFEVALEGFVSSFKYSEF